MHGGDEKFAKFWLESLKGKLYLETLSIDGEIIFKWMLKK
jgi:hypothetical protein